VGLAEVVAWYVHNWLPELDTLGYADPLPPPTSAIQATLIYIKEIESSTNLCRLWMWRHETLCHTRLDAPYWRCPIQNVRKVSID
jgi:hypothetical protein